MRFKLMELNPIAAGWVLSEVAILCFTGKPSQWWHLGLSAFAIGWLIGNVIRMQRRRT